MREKFSGSSGSVRRNLCNSDAGRANRERISLLGDQIASLNKAWQDRVLL